MPRKGMNDAFVLHGHDQAIIKYFYNRFHWPDKSMRGNHALLFHIVKFVSIRSNILGLWKALKLVDDKSITDYSESVGNLLFFMCVNWS